MASDQSPIASEPVRCDALNTKKCPRRGLIFPSKLVRFLSIALDASVTHMYPPGTRRHIKAALALGATMEEIIAVLKVCVAKRQWCAQARCADPG